MDVFIDKNDSGSILYKGSLSGKRKRMKKRRTKVRSIVDWVEDGASDTDSCNLIFENNYVIRISNTKRQLGDPALENCECIAATEVLEGKSRCGQVCTSEEFVTSFSLELSYLRKGLSEPLVCSEAFKLLEKDFSEVLKNLCNIKEYAKVVEDGKGIELAGAKRQNWPIAKSGWVETVSFGVFAEAVLMLNTTDIDGMVVGRRHKKTLHNVKTKLTKKIWEALEEGISMLEEDNTYAEVQDFRIENAISFLRNRENLIATLNEWTANSHLRTRKNSSSHPFSSAATNDVRVAALKYYDIILGSNFSENFRHVGELGRLKLKTVTTSIEMKAMKDANNNDMMEALLALCKDEDEGTDVEEADSSGSSDSDSLVTSGFGTS